MNASQVDSLVLSRKWSRTRALAQQDRKSEIRHVELRDAIVRVRWPAADLACSSLRRIGRT
jgi:hypothetical protein